MGAAKKVVQLERKAKKAELIEVVKKPNKSAKVTPFKDFGGLAQDLTRERGMTHEEVEALLETKTEAVLPKTAPEVEAGVLNDGTDAASAPMPEAPRRDMSKVALFASLVAVILLLGFYFNLNQNLKNLTTQVQDLASIKTSVATLNTKVGTMESKVADLETLPAKTRAALMSSILEEMSQKTSYMSSQLQSPEQQDKLMKAKELIQQVQTELNTQN
jgi:outer membrane murein-binding lipoprotein Lpp